MRTLSLPTLGLGPRHMYMVCKPGWVCGVYSDVCVVFGCRFPRLSGEECESKLRRKGRDEEGLGKGAEGGAPDLRKVGA